MDDSTDLPAPIAPIWRRLLAWAVDWAVWLVVLAAAAGVDAAAGRTDEDGGLAVLAAIALLLGSSIAFQALGTSPGLAALHIRIVRRDGARPGIARGFARWLVVALPSGAALALDAILLLAGLFSGGFALLVVLGLVATLEVIAHVPHLWALFRRDRRTLQDLAARTWVVMRP